VVRLTSRGRVVARGAVAIPGQTVVSGMPPAPALAHISDTARWVAMYRALETERPDALFHDPHARRLAGSQGEEILRTVPKARSFAWPMIVRTPVMDEILLRVVREDGADAVLNLAAGLDTRPYRLSLPSSTRWIDADLPAVLDYKREQLRDERPACAVEFAPGDLTDRRARRELLDRVARAAKKVIVITEGLLVYLEREQVAELAGDLAAMPAFRWWLIDLGSPRLLKMLRRTWGNALSTGNAPMIFAPPEGTAFFQPLGWREREFRSTWEESIRLDRSVRFARIWYWLGRLYPKRMRDEFHRMSGIVLLERAPT
jgi:methyltransferase (TIGR00027 family)